MIKLSLKIDESQFNVIMVLSTMGADRNFCKREGWSGGGGAKKTSHRKNKSPPPHDEKAYKHGEKCQPADIDLQTLTVINMCSGGIAFMCVDADMGLEMHYVLCAIKKQHFVKQVS